jgi:PAS domain S-box-containing protein
LAADAWVESEKDKLAPASGILMLPDGPVLMVASPILTTERQGPARGVLLMTRNLDRKLVESLKELTLSALTITPRAELREGESQAIERRLELAPETIYVKPSSAVSVAGYALLRDIHHQPALLLRVETPRAIFQRGLISLRYLFVALSLATFVYGVTTLWLLRHIVLAPLTRLSEEVGRIREHKNLSERVLLRGRDEIARLGQAINQMLAALEKSANLEQMNRVLQKEMHDRLLAESAREEATRLALFAATVGECLTRATDLRAGLQESSEAFVRSLELAFARVWVCNEGGDTLELEASAGIYTHLDGAHARVPVGAMKIGRIAESRTPHLTNDVLNDPQVSNPEWARREGMVAFAGYPLIVEGRLVGVVAAFARHALARTVLDSFASVADQIAQFIERMRVQRALEASNEHFQQLFATIPVPVWLRARSSGRFLEVNDAAVRCYGYSREEFLQMTIADIVAPEPVQAPVNGDSVPPDAPPKQRHRLRDGQVIDVELNTCLVQFTRVPALLVAAQDVTRRNQMEVELRHGQKLQAVGALAAGVAHEINTPIQFVGDNVRFLQDAFSALAGLVEKYDTLLAGVDGQATSGLFAQFRQEREKADIEFLGREVPLALEQTCEGVQRVATIVQALKTFSHVDAGSEKKMADLNAALRSTLVVARNELKYLAEVETRFADLPPVRCHLGDLNQVFLNLLLNAVHSIGDVVGASGKKGHILVETQSEVKPDGEWVVVAISDTGKGIPEEIRGRIFEPFFTTKQVGKGSGQGLALARAIVVDRHGGTLTFDSHLGQGTTFYVRIPVDEAGSKAPVLMAAAT